MKNGTFFLVLVVMLFLSCNESNVTAPKQALASDVHTYAMVIHGGAGSASRDNMSPEREKKYRDKLNQVLSLGQSMLADSVGAMAVVVECIKMMEESPLFNAGKGAVLTYKGRTELDASIMDGQSMDAGSVAGVQLIKSPIEAARAVMEKSPHVLLARTGAEEFARGLGLDMVEPGYFITENKKKVLERVQQKKMLQDEKHGTVGVVALDMNGNIAAGTSTGGMTNKRWSRIGDSPIIGAGTYAQNGVGGVSCTGHGEYFIRYAVAYDLIARTKYTSGTMEQCAEEIVNKELVAVGASGGLVALDAQGRPSMPHNTSGMFRGYVNDREKFVGIFKDEVRSK